MLFQGTVQNILVTILLDSGSSSSFISESVVQSLPKVTLESHPCSVQVAGGGILKSSAVARQLKWSVGSCQFQSDFKILQLSACDMIVGMDWLESFSPMQIHWSAKWVAIPYNGQTHILQGLGSTVREHLLLHLEPVDFTETTDPSEPQLPEPIQQLLSEYSEICASYFITTITGLQSPNPVVARRSALLHSCLLLSSSTKG